MPISSDLVDSLKRMGVDLLDRISSYDSLVVKDIEWVPVDRVSPASTAGVDSSRQYEVYRGFIVYAIQGYAVALTREGSLLASLGDADSGYLDVVEASRIGVRVARDSLISSASKTLEVRLLNSIVKNWGVELALLDGSYESFLGPILVFKGELRKAAPRLAGKIRELWEGRVKLLNEIAGLARLAFISKSSSKSTLVERGGVRVESEGSTVVVPDFIVVRRALATMNVRTPGFIWYPNPYVELRKGGDEVVAIASRLSRWYTLTYILLHPAGRVYQLTIPGKLGKEEVREIVEKLRSIAPDGYPRPLSIAHHLSTLRRGEFKKLLSMIIPHLETGREELERVIGGSMLEESHLKPPVE